MTDWIGSALGRLSNMTAFDNDLSNNVEDRRNNPPIDDGLKTRIHRMFNPSEERANRQAVAEVTKRWLEETNQIPPSALTPPPIAELMPLLKQQQIDTANTDFGPNDPLYQQLWKHFTNSFRFR